MQSSSSCEGVGDKSSGVLASGVEEGGEQEEARLPLFNDAASADATSDPLMLHMQGKHANPTVLVSC